MYSKQVKYEVSFGTNALVNSGTRVFKKKVYS